MIDIENELYMCETKTELKSLIRRLGQERKNLMLKLNPNRLADAADLMAEAGRIHNTPKAKADWIAGK